MNRNRRIAVVGALVGALMCGLVVMPRRYEVEGVSMGPGLLPGDVVTTGWLPALDHRQPPQRFDRWIVTLPDGSTGLKRVIGLPGEQVAIIAGDLAIEGQTVLKGPRLLATMGSEVELAVPHAKGDANWSLPPATVLDDAPFAIGEVSRVLLPVRDVGFAAEVDVPIAAGPRAKDTAGPRLRASAGPLAVTWRLAGPGRYAVVAGRLDGYAVAAAWPLPAGFTSDSGNRSCLPSLPPKEWDIARPWPVDPGQRAEDDDRSPALSLAVSAAESAAVVITGITLWRDILYRPAADGVADWTVTSGEVFAVGDFPSGSRDSRHFGPLPLMALRYRLRAP